MGLAAFGVGIIVGLTGMGGGALMTPVLVLFFGVPPLSAVSSDLVASAVMKPVGSAVHLHHGTVNLGLVKWLALGSVPSAFSAVLLLKLWSPADGVQEFIQAGLGVALLLTAVLLGVRSYLQLSERTGARLRKIPRHAVPRPAVRRLPTVLLGVLGGTFVGLTSVGSGSIVLIGLMLLYPGLKAGQLVGTDLLQAVPLVSAAALGHSLFGELNLAVTVPLVLGGIPGVFLGAQLCARMPGGLVRRVLAFVLVASALKMLGVGNTPTAVVLLAALFVGMPVWMQLRRRLGLPAVAGAWRPRLLSRPRPGAES